MTKIKLIISSIIIGIIVMLITAFVITVKVKNAKIKALEAQIVDLHKDVSAANASISFQNEMIKTHEQNAAAAAEAHNARVAEIEAKYAPRTQARVTHDTSCEEKLQHIIELQHLFFKK